MSITASAKVLIFDADDTLWENNVLFERVIDSFLGWVARPDLRPEQARAVLDEIETANSATHGYGSTIFLRSLHECFERLSGRPADTGERATIDRFADALVQHEVELIPGVADTLDQLGRGHTLVLLTKGEQAEQQRKIDASGLAARFDHVHIVPEKNVDTYHALIEEHGLTPADTWMIGNSPRSDIRPARAAGLGAVFIPNAHTWVLEHDELDPGDDRVLSLPVFTDLLRHFRAGAVT